MKEFNDEKNFITIYKKLVKNPERFPFVVVKNRGYTFQMPCENVEKPTPVVSQEMNVGASKIRDEIKEYFMQNMIYMKNYYDFLNAKNAKQYLPYGGMSVSPQMQMYPQLNNSVNNNQANAYMNMMALLYLKNAQNQSMCTPTPLV